jgi:pyruvate-ferredoxin/flavodoxin oxidoreductase
VFGLQVQAYPKYGSEKKGLPTTFYLSLSEERILTHCELDDLDFVPIQDVNAFLHSNPLKGLVEGGMAFLQSGEKDPAKVWARIPKRFKKMFLEKKLRLLYMDMVKVAQEMAPTTDLVMRMQGIVLTGVFLKMTPYKEKLGWSDEEFFNRVRVTLDKYFGKRGEAVVNANLEAVKRGFKEVLEVPRDVMEAELAAK